MTCEVINNIIGIENYTYLELGVDQNQNFEQILCRKKMSVDLNGNAIYRGSTDDFFAFIKDSGIKFDITFIDANHDYDYALRDYNNAVLHTSKWIIMHDMIPPAKEYIKSTRCSDSFKILWWMYRSGYPVYSMNDVYGTIFIKVPAPQCTPDDTAERLVYEDFVAFMADKKRYTPAEIAQLLNS